MEASLLSMFVAAVSMSFAVAARSLRAQCFSTCFGPAFPIDKTEGPHFLAELSQACTHFCESRKRLNIFRKVLYNINAVLQHSILGAAQLAHAPERPEQRAHGFALWTPEARGCRQTSMRVHFCFLLVAREILA